jgi:hypothetical protein
MGYDVYKILWGKSDSESPNLESIRKSIVQVMNLVCGIQ